MMIATLIEKLQEDISWLGYNPTEKEIIEHIKCAITLLKEQEPVRCKDCAYAIFKEGMMQGYSSIAEMMRDSECPIDKKLKLIGQIRGFVTINGITKDDLFEMLGVVYDLLKTRVAMKY